MNTKKVSGGMTSKSQKVLVSLLVVFLLVGFFPVREAHAWSMPYAVGRIGQVHLYTVNIGDSFSYFGAPDFTLYGKGPIVYRTTGSTGAQIVTVTYMLEQWDGYKWVLITNPYVSVLRGQIASNQAYVQLGNAQLRPTVSRGYFRFRWDVAWSTSTGVVLGTTIILPNLVADHTCVTPYRLCQVYPGYFRTGGQGTRTW
jgi:hypothetical protein